MGRGKSSIWRSGYYEDMGRHAVAPADCSHHHSDCGADKMGAAAPKKILTLFYADFIYNRTRFIVLYR